MNAKWKDYTDVNQQSVVVKASKDLGGTLGSAIR
jgi:hypothetical protein